MEGKKRGGGGGGWPFYINIPTHENILFFRAFAWYFCVLSVLFVCVCAMCAALCMCVCVFLCVCMYCS